MLYANSNVIPNVCEESLFLFLDRDSSLRIRFVQNDMLVVSNDGERCLAIRSLSVEILHYTSFHSEWHCTAKAVPFDKEYFLLAVVKITPLSFRTYVRNPIQDAHLAGDSSVLRTSEWHALDRRLFTSHALRSEWHICRLECKWEILQNDEAIICLVCRVFSDLPQGRI